MIVFALNIRRVAKYIPIYNKKWKYYLHLFVCTTFYEKFFRKHVFIKYGDSIDVDYIVKI